MNTATNTAAVETNNTNVNVEGQEGNTAVQPEVNALTFVMQKEKPTFEDFQDLVAKNLYDGSFYEVMHNLADAVALKMEPKNYDEEIGKLQSELLATKDLTKRFGVMEAITNLMNEQASQGSEIRTKLEGVSFAEIAVAYSKDIQALVDGVVLDFLKRSPTAVLKFKRSPKDGTATTTSAGPVETITFEVKGVTHTVKAGKGRLNSEILVIAEEHAKAVKDEAAKTKPVFIQALKDGKVKGAKVIKVETV